MNSVTDTNRQAWEDASRKHVREYDELLAQAAAESSLNAIERDLLAGVLASAPEVVHLQSGHGLDDAALVQAGARSVTGVDYSAVAAGAAQRRADELGLACRYVVGTVPGTPLADGCADLVYTGKGAIIWMRSIRAWAHDAARLLRPGGHLFVYEGHPAVPLWTWDSGAPGIRDDRSYFARSHVNDSFPARGATEFQWTLGEILTAVIAAGLDLLSAGAARARDARARRVPWPSSPGQPWRPAFAPPPRWRWRSPCRSRRSGRPG